MLKLTSNHIQLELVMHIDLSMKRVITHMKCITRFTAVGYNTLGHKHVVPALILYIYIYIYGSLHMGFIWLFVSVPFF